MGACASKAGRSAALQPTQTVSGLGGPCSTLCIPLGVVGGEDNDGAQTDMPFRSRAQYAFKDSMIHGILQFTLRIAFRCVLHRYESQDIHC